MKKFNLLIMFLFIPVFLESVTQSEKYWEAQAFENIPKGLGFHSDLGYSSYLIELHSSEMDSAIDYDIWEATLGFSYVHDNWLVGIYGKFVIDEIESNMFVVTTQAPLNNSALINKSEFAFYVNYVFLETQRESWGINGIYRYASLEASDSYNSFFNYISYFQYRTDGLAFSLAYQRRVFKKGMLFSSIGLLYSKAKVKMSESINGQFQDSFIDDSVNALGFKLSVGYKYECSEDISLHLRTDMWKQSFQSLSVSSQVGDSLPFASLKESSYTTYLGMDWRF